MNWYRKMPRYIDGELIENQWIWFGCWLIYHPDGNDYSLHLQHEIP